MEQEHNEHEEHQTTEEAPVKQRRAGSALLKGLASSIGGIIVIVLVVGVVAAYRAPDSVPVIPGVLAAVHAPAASVNGDIITWNDIKVDSDALAKYLANPSAPATNYSADQLRTRVLHRLMLTAAAEQIAKEKGVEITEERLNQELDSLAATSGGKEKVAADILANFGWTYEQYRDRVVRSMLIMQELQKNLRTENGGNSELRTKAESVLAELKSGKKDFATLAKEYSEDSSAVDGGDLGPIRKGLTVEPFENALFALKKGEVSGVVETEFGFHIIKAEDVKKDKKGVVEEVRARHILFKFQPVIVKIKDYLNQASVNQFIKTDVPAKNDPDAAQENS